MGKTGTEHLAVGWFAQQAFWSMAIKPRESISDGMLWPSADYISRHALSRFRFLQSLAEEIIPLGKPRKSTTSSRNIPFHSTKSNDDSFCVFATSGTNRAIPLHWNFGYFWDQPKGKQSCTFLNKNEIFKTICTIIVG